MNKSIFLIVIILFIGYAHNKDHRDQQVKVSQRRSEIKHDLKGYLKKNLGRSQYDNNYEQKVDDQGSGSQGNNVKSIMKCAQEKCSHELSACYDDQNCLHILQLCKNGEDRDFEKCLEQNMNANQLAHCLSQCKES